MVYVGCTCRCRRPLGQRCPREVRCQHADDSLTSRLLEYARNGSHKSNLINQALKDGYQIWVRTKKVDLEGQQDGQRGAPNRVERKREAERMENVLLARYDYKWNIRRNGGIRL